MFELVSLVQWVVVVWVELDVVTQVQEQQELISLAAVWCPDPQGYLCPPLLVVVGPNHRQQAPQYGQVLGLLPGQPILGAAWEDYLL